MPELAELLKRQSRIISINTGEIWFCENRVVIDSRVPLSDLKLREFGKLRILFENECYFVSEKSQSSSKPIIYRYVLSPWPKNDEAVTRTITLNESYFREIGAERKRTLMEAAAFSGLFIFYPFLGLLWSPQKRALNRIGFESQAVSSSSVYLEFILALISGVFFVVFGFPVFLLLAAFVFALDAVVRLNRLLIGNDLVPPGFYEWLIRRKAVFE